MTPGAKRLRTEYVAALQPIERRSVVEWATAHIVLPEMVSQNDGHYSTDHCRYVDEALEDFRDPTATDNTWCWAAQCFKTTALMVGLAYKIDQHPENAIWAMPNGDLLKAFAKTKWLPIVEASPVLQARKPKDADKFTNLEQQYGRMVVSFIATGAQKNSKGRSAGVIIVDEIDDVEEEYNKKGQSVIGMLDSRTKSFTGSKVFKTGTPQLSTGPSWQGFMNGDRRLRFVDCPKCGKETTIEFSPEHTQQYFPGVPACRVVWGEDAGFPSAKLANGEWDMKAVAASARVKCPHCAGLWNEGEKMLAERAGRWKATNPLAVEGKRSRRLPSIYSPHPKCSISALAVKFLSCLSQPGGLRNFLNEECALPYVPKGTTVTKSDIQRIVEHSPEYVLGEIPRDNLALMTMTVDVQQTNFWWTQRALFGDGATALIDYGEAISWSELLEILARTYPIKGTDRTAGCLFGLIDMGFKAKRTGGVYDFCLGIAAGRFHPCQGRSSTGHNFSKTVGDSPQNHKGLDFSLTQFNDDIFKHDLYLTKIKGEGAGKWWLPRNIGKDYEAQLTDEYLTEKEGWKCREDNNHLGDCEKMQLIVPALIKEKGMQIIAAKVSGGGR